MEFLIGETEHELIAVGDDAGGHVWTLDNLPNDLGKPVAEANVGMNAPGMYKPLRNVLFVPYGLLTKALKKLDQS